MLSEEAKALTESAIDDILRIVKEFGREGVLFVFEQLEHPDLQVVFMESMLHGYFISPATTIRWVEQ